MGNDFAMVEHRTDLRNKKARELMVILSAEEDPNAEELKKNHASWTRTKVWFLIIRQQKFKWMLLRRIVLKAKELA